jgi:hypothetical protein
MTAVSKKPRPPRSTPGGPGFRGGLCGRQALLIGETFPLADSFRNDEGNRPVDARLRASVFLPLALAFGLPASADESSPSREDVVAAMRPYDGPSAPGVDRSTLTGKVLCGYQGWFTAPGDGSGRGWRHYPARGRFRPGSCGIDLWPDVSELDEDERYATPFRHEDGRVAQVFSSHNRKTVLRHFRWMRQYGIDGVFVQRFGVETLDPNDLRHGNAVLAHCREGANRSGRCYAVMYDLSGLPEGGVRHVIEDWKLLVDRMRIGTDPEDAAYLRHGGRPVVAVWGVGFNDGRKYTLAECERLVDFLKNDRRYGGFTVLLGVPTGWRALDADSVNDPALHRVIGKADIASPWTVGRYRSLEGVEDHARRRWRQDLEWCRANGKAYLPVAFPGFSWHNRRPEAPSEEIPRQKGQFLWKQYVEAKEAGATAVYQAMFDEMDEGTAIFKCTDDPPVGESRFLTLGGLPSDHYLWLAGTGGKLLRGEVEAAEEVPPRKADGGTGPTVKKLGTLDLLMVETTPVVFKGRLYRFEYVRDNYPANETGASYFRFNDVATGKATPAFAKGRHLGCAFVEGDTVYAFGVDKWGGSQITVFRSKDMEQWEDRPALHLPGWSVYNTSVCKADGRYVMAVEVGGPKEVVGVPFTIFFAESQDLLTWTPLPRECVYSKERYTACPALRYTDGYFYMVYLEARPGPTYETHIVRSKDLRRWESSRLNPVLAFSDEDKRIANPGLTAEQRKAIAGAKDINNSDVDLCEYRGRTVIYYSWGNQQGTEFLAEAVYEGTLADFLHSYFP